MIRLRSTNVRTDNVLKKFSFTNALFLVSRASSRITGLFAYHGPVARDWLFYNLQPARTASESRATPRD
jgi:hypothetical protein